MVFKKVCVFVQSDKPCCSVKNVFPLHVQKEHTLHPEGGHSSQRPGIAPSAFQNTRLSGTATVVYLWRHMNASGIVPEAKTKESVETTYVSLLLVRWRMLFHLCSALQFPTGFWLTTTGTKCCTRKTFGMMQNGSSYKLFAE